jgi:hypothetical protein
MTPQQAYRRKHYREHRDEYIANAMKHYHMHREAKIGRRRLQVA